MAKAEKVVKRRKRRKPLESKTFPEKKVIEHIEADKRKNEKEMLEKQPIDERKVVNASVQAETLPFDGNRYNYAGVERINNIPCYEKTLNKNFLENVITKYLVMEPAQLEEESMHPRVTILERMIMEQVLSSLNPTTQIGLTNAKYLQERIAGKARERIEHTGADGGAIQISQAEVDKNFDAMLSNLSDKELDTYEKAINAIGKLKEKHG